MRLLLFNLATDLDNPTQGFNTRWIWALAKRVEFINVITMRAGRIEMPNNVRVYSVGKEKGYSEPRRAMEFYWRLFRIILREDRIDACFSHMIPIFTILAAPVLKAKRIPIVTWYAHRQVTTILKVAHHLSDRMVTSTVNSYRYKHDKLTVVGQGIDSDLFSPNGTLPDNPPLLLAVGRISPIKDLLTLVAAIHLLRQRGYSLRCALVGSPPERDNAYAEEVRRKVQALGLEDSVEFIGPVPNDQVVQWYRRSFAHVSCSPSDQSVDKTVLEAMACGKPSLSSTLGFKETMDKWADGLLFQQADPEDLTRKLEWLLRLSDADRQAIGMDLRERVVKQHNLEQLADKLLALLSSLRHRTTTPVSQC
jgi:glycosyltransferase involved in cell wall biosynthesis